MQNPREILDEQWWNLAEELRDRHELSVDLLIEAAHERGMPVTWRHVWALEVQFQGKNGQIIPPPLPVQFLRTALGGEKPLLALDPWAQHGVVLSALAEADVIQKGIGYCPSPAQQRTAETICNENDIVFRVGSAPSALPETDVDLIVSFPPLGHRAKQPVTTSPSGAALREEVARVLPLSRALSESGQIVLSVTPGALFRTRGNPFRHLDEYGLHLNAVIAVEEGALSPWTAISTALVFLSREPTDELFVGKLEQGMDFELLAENLHQRKVGTSIQYGTLVPHDKFTTWRQLELEVEIERLAEQQGLQPVVIGDIADEIVVDRAKRGSVEARENERDTRLEYRDNALYFPLAGSHPVSTALDEVQECRTDLAQIVLPPEKLDARYLVRFFQSELGKKVREHASQGVVVRRVSGQALENMVAYVPPMEVQEEIAEVDANIRSLQLQLEKFNHQLSKYPFSVSSVSKQLRTFNRDDLLEMWVEELPFPLASILWRYHAENNAEKKNQLLFYFFEALAAFVCTLMMSGFYSDEAFFEKNRDYWFQDLPADQLLKRATFGVWVRIGQRLAKTTRQLLDSGEPGERERCVHFFGVGDDALPRILSSKKLFEVLLQVNDYRNDWKGHDGFASAQEYRRRLSYLENALTEVRREMQHAFDNVYLLKPGQFQLTGGTYHSTCEAVQGKSAIFQKVPVTTIIPMDSEHLYILGKQSNRPMEVLPFFRLTRSPDDAENACYFYNRFDGDDVRWVTYHFERESAFHEAEPELERFIEFASSTA